MFRQAKNIVGGPEIEIDSLWIRLSSR